MPAAANVSPAPLSVVVSLTRFPVSEYRPCFLPTVPRPGASFPPLGSCGPVPQLRRYYEALRFPADRLALLGLCFAWRYHPRASVFVSPSRPDAGLAAWDFVVWQSPPVMVGMEP